MGFIDVFSAEDKMEIKYSEFYNLIRGCTQRDMIVNAVKSKVPHKYISAMMGESLNEPIEVEEKG